MIKHAAPLHPYLCIFISHPIAPQDYASTTKLLSFSATNTERNVSIPIRDDSISEGHEHFFASLTTEQNVSLIPSTAVIIIGDNDGMFHYCVP